MIKTIIICVNVINGIDYAHTYYIPYKRKQFICLKQITFEFSSLGIR